MKNKNTTKVEEVIKSINDCVCMYDYMDESVWEELEFYGKDYKTLTDEEKEEVLEYFRTNYEDEWVVESIENLA